MKKTILTYLFPSLFLLILVIPTMNSTFKIWKFERPNENRVFRDSLSIDIKKLDNFPTDFEAFYNDNFSFRSPLHSLYHDLKHYVYQVSPDENQIIIGKDGYYYLGKEEKEIFEGRKEFSKLEMFQFYKVWNERMEYFNSKNIKTYWLICPTKYRIYPEKLPYNVYSGKEINRTTTLTNYLHEKLPFFILDPTDKLKRSKIKESLFFRYDNHWNMRAGAIVSEYVLRHIQKDFPGIDTDFLTQYHWKDSLITGGIHKATLGIDGLYEYSAIPTEKKLNAQEAELFDFEAPADFAYPWDFQYRFKNEKSGKYRILVIRDSFGNALIPFLKEPFSESVFIFDAWKYGLNKEIIDKVKPDIVLYITLDTHLDNLIGH